LRQYDFQVWIQIWWGHCHHFYESVSWGNFIGLLSRRLA